MQTHAQFSITACSTGQSVDHLHNRGDENLAHGMYLKFMNHQHNDDSELS